MGEPPHELKGLGEARLGGKTMTFGSWDSVAAPARTGKAATARPTRLGSGRGPPGSATLARTGSKASMPAATATADGGDGQQAALSGSAGSLTVAGSAKAATRSMHQLLLDPAVGAARGQGVTRSAILLRSDAADGAAAASAAASSAGSGASIVHAHSMVLKKGARDKLKVTTASTVNLGGPSSDSPASFSRTNPGSSPRAGGAPMPAAKFVFLDKEIESSRANMRVMGSVIALTPHEIQAASNPPVQTVSVTRTGFPFLPVPSFEAADQEMAYLAALPPSWEKTIRKWVASSSKSSSGRVDPRSDESSGREQRLGSQDSLDPRTHALDEEGTKVRIAPLSEFSLDLQTQFKDIDLSSVFETLHSPFPSRSGCGES
jgi:hypothetical protein